MIKKISSFTALTAIILALSLFVLPKQSIFAEIADGTYEINYEMKENGSDSTSISDGYFASPATLTVKDGVQEIQLTVTSAEMIKSLSGPNGAVDVVSDSGDSRTVKFRVDGDLSQPVTMSMHVVVPDMEEMPGGYDKDHTARAVFDVSGLEQATSDEDNDNDDEDNVSENEEVAGSENEEATGGEQAEDNPPTGDSSSIVLYSVLLLASVVGIFVIRKTRTAKD